MVEIVISIASKVAEYLVAPVGRQLGYLFHYNSNMLELRDQVEKLDYARRKLLRSVDAAERRGEGIEDDVQKWLTGANSISREAQEFIEDEKKAKKSCFKGLCPNLISRYQLSRQAKEKAQEVKKNQEEGDFQTISYRLPLPGAGSAPPQGYQAFESRASTLNKVMDAIRDDKMKMIGVWGMAGVGKTTLVKQVAKLAEDDKLFDKVVMVAVSREQNSEKIRTQIAELLDLRIEETSELGRAGRLIELLKKKKVLIILDDIWEKLNLEAVGIPYGEDHKGLKIVVTSRRKEILSEDMVTQENFEVRILSGDEAWQLFQDTAGDCIQKFDLQSVAMQVAQKCGGLPIAIVTVAKALKDKSSDHWRDALRQLTSTTKTDIRGMSEHVYKSLQFSYNYLENEDAKSLFLLCGWLGYGDISMDDLFKYSIGLRLFPSIKTLEASADRLQVLVDRLKASSLLLDSRRKEHVKMHDVVRDVARDIASNDPHQFVVIEATQSEDWSSEIRESTRYIHLSSSHQGTPDLPQRLVCPKLEFFFLVNGGPWKNIPDSFFNGMGKLKVLHLLEMEFSSPPLSLQSLANLQTLCLDWCTLGDVAGIGELKQLQVLSFRGSNIEQLPKEIAQLTCLRLLDLSKCRQLQVIPPNILSKLSRLEHLCIEPQWEDEESNAALFELKHLSRLTTLNIALRDLKLLPKGMVFEKLTRYKIFIGPQWLWGQWLSDRRSETKRVLNLYKANRSVHLVDGGIGKLLKKTEELSLTELSGAKSVFYEFEKEDFLQLKHLDVSRSPEIQYIVDSKYPLQEHALFPSMESLLLRDLINLEKVCHGPIRKGSFGNLKTLKVKNCHGLKILLSLTMATCFLHLQEIKIGDCDFMQQIMAYERESEIIEDGHAGTTSQPFPKLRCLELDSLPELTNFSSELEGNRDIHISFFNHQVTSPNLEELKLNGLPKLKKIWHHQLSLEFFCNLRILSVYDCPRLVNLVPSYLIQSLQNLKEIDVKDCEVLEHVFDLRGLNGDVGILPKIEVLKLEKLPRLRDVICSEDKNTIKDFHHLKELRIIDCEMLLDEKVLFPPNLEVLVLESLLKLKEIDVGIKLKTLHLEKLPRLRIVNDNEDKNTIKDFHHLKELHIIDCGMLLDEMVLFPPNLEVLVLKSLPKLKEIDVGILLPKFKILSLKKLPRLRHIICNEDKNDNKRCLLSFIFKGFHNLQKLRIIDCGIKDERDVYASMNDVVLFNKKVSFPDGVSYEAFESRASTFNKIMDALRDGEINLIGVWGMHGVGKTTLVKQVAQQAKQLLLFTTQLYIDASWTRDSEKLQQGISGMQQNIADMLDIEVGGWNESTIANELKQRLQKVKILIILDDLWEKVDLEEVGIPSKDDAARCKIVLTSRDGDLLCKDMGVQECFPVEQLPPEEAWSLFKKTAGDSMEENLDLQPIASQVVEECEGLPIAIVTIAKALKDETVAVWKNVLEELRRSAPTNIRGVGNKVYSCLEWSFTHLKGDDVKSLFLLCGMLGYHDISVDLLLQYCLDLDMFDHIDSLDLEQATNKLLTLVQILKASNLLFFNADNNSVRMHDVVSDVARAIASKDPHPFIIREDVGFEEWSKTDESKRCTFISLNCKLVTELPHGLVCPELQIFQLQNNNPSLNIPNTFFEGMKKLKVLNLSEMNFTTLPSSLDSLANLRTLRLYGCKLVDIALIGKLTKLEVLSLGGSTIQQLSQEMVQLTNLRLLDLNDCKELKVIPRNILSSLSRLECLYMKSCSIQWAVEGESSACLSELNHLSHLTTLDIGIPDAKLLPKDILFENLTRYTICIGSDGWDSRTKRALMLRNVNRSLHLGDGVSKLFERSEELEFRALSGTKYVLYPSDRESFLELKHLRVYQSSEIQYIIDSKDQRFLQHGAFPLLESLVLESLNNLEEVWHGPIPIGSFGNLKTLNIHFCNKLKFLFVLSTARGLSQLEEMKIEYCFGMEQIIACERESESEIKEDGDGGTNLQLFPKLRTLKLRYLSQLINFSSGLETTSSTSQTTNAMSEGSFLNHQFSFPILEELELDWLPKLNDIWLHQLVFGSCNLRILKVEDCPYLLNLVSPNSI